MAVLGVAQPSVGVGSVALGAVNAAGGGDSFPNDGYTVLYVKNGSGGAITVTIDGVGAGPESAVAYNPDVAVSVAAGAERLIGPFTDKARFNDVNGRVNVSYSGVTSLTVAPVRVY